MNVKKVQKLELAIDFNHSDWTTGLHGTEDSFKAGVDLTRKFTFLGFFELNRKIILILKNKISGNFEIEIKFEIGVQILNVDP